MPLLITAGAVGSVAGIIILKQAMQRFHSFPTTERTLEGVEALHMMSKGQVKRLAKSDAVGQAKFVASLFQSAA